MGYLSLAEISSLFGDPVANGIVTEAQLTTMVGIVDGLINSYLGVSTNLASGVTYGACRAIAGDLIGAYILRVRKYRETNLAEPEVFPSYYPQLSKKQIELLLDHATKRVRITHRRTMGGII